MYYRDISITTMSLLLLYQKGYLDAHSISGSGHISVLKSSFDISLHVIGFVESHTVCKSDTGNQKCERD
jgi:hypothetical protein